MTTASLFKKPGRFGFIASIQCAPASWSAPAPWRFSFRFATSLRIAQRISFLALISTCNAAAEATNALTLTQPSLDNVGPSLLRVLGALALVLAIFLGGVWLFRNWQRLALQRGRAPRLNVLEVRSLGGRHALYVVGYEQERFLVAASPAGVNLVSHLQPAEADPTDPAASPAPPSFAQALTDKLKGK